MTEELGQVSIQSKLNCTDIKSESFGEEQIEELTLSVESCCFSEG